MERLLGCRLFEKRSWRTIELGQDRLIQEDEVDSRSYLTNHCCRCCFQVHHNDEI